MAQKLITHQKFKNLRATEKEQLIADGGALYVRVRKETEGGAVSFRMKYRFQKKQQWIDIDADSLPEARKQRDNIRDLIKAGRDPKIERQIELTKSRNEQMAELSRLESLITVRDLFDRWEATDLKNRKDGGAEVRRMFEKDVFPSIGKMPIGEIRKGDIANIVDALLLRGVNRMAKLVLSLIRQMFRFAVERDLLEFDPSAAIRKNKIGKDTERDRTLSDDEVRMLCKKIPEAGLMNSTEHAIWIMLSTCCRVGELSKAKWSDIDFQAQEWNIPAENAKNGRNHTIFLSNFAIKQFRQIHDLRTQDDWVFPDRSGENHVCEKSLTKQIRDRQTDKPLMNRSAKNEALKLPGGRWTPHDLRRTGATIMGDLGIVPDVIERCLNHTEQNRMKRTYQRMALKAEQTEAWRILGERLELLTNQDADNVVILAAKRA